MQIAEVQVFSLVFLPGQRSAQDGSYIFAAGNSRMLGQLPEFLERELVTNPRRIVDEERSVELIGQRDEVVEDLGPGHRLIPRRECRVVIVGKVLEELGSGQGSHGPLVGDIQNQRNLAAVFLNGHLCKLALIVVREQVEPGGGTKNPESVDPCIKVISHQLVESAQINC